MEGGTWAQQEGTGVVSGARGSCVAGGRRQNPVGEHSGWGPSLPAPLDLRAAPTAREEEEPVWCRRSEPEWVGVRGAPWRKSPSEQRSILGTGVGMMVAEAGAGEVEEAATPKMLQAPGHCHLTLGDLFSCPPPRLPGHEHPALQPPSPTLKIRRPVHLPDPLLHRAMAGPWHSTTALLTQGLRARTPESKPQLGHGVPAMRTSSSSS